mmetsp:Transcript_16413/g.25507  ORF Transcript_16413/g.25507 Transcript_16413/m.25507 type:complete len:164 (-) Transcript_16413:168-659(-)
MFVSISSASKRHKLLAHCLSQQKLGERERMILEAKRPREGEMTIKDQRALGFIQQHLRDRDVARDGISEALESVKKRKEGEKKKEEEDEFNFLRDDYLIPFDSFSASDKDFGEEGERSWEAREEEEGEQEVSSEEDDEKGKEEEENVWVPVTEDDYDENMVMY